MDEKELIELQGEILEGIDAISDAPSDIEYREKARMALERFQREYRELQSRQLCASHNAKLYSDRTQELQAEVVRLKRENDEMYRELSYTEPRRDENNF